ncbi:MAG: Asp-tRNA(Asn)/Glu-tRNA(Gln) amidotransferase subunit GatC [Candidatus Sungiibacteriota bacterium]
MAITREEVKRIAALARITLTAEEEELYEKELSSVLAFVAELEKLDVRDVAPMTGRPNGRASPRWAGGTDLMTVMHEDAVGDADLEGKSADLLAAVPECENGWVKVKSVF